MYKQKKMTILRGTAEQRTSQLQRCESSSTSLINGVVYTRSIQTPGKKQNVSYVRATVYRP